MFTGADRNTDYAAFGVGWDRRVIALPDRAPTRAWTKRFHDIGVKGLPKPVPYGSIDVTVGDTRWRLLYLTTFMTPVRQWEEQSFWLPKAVDSERFDRLLVFADGPVYTLGEGAVAGRGAAYLLDRIQDHSDPMSFVGFIAG